VNLQYIINVDNVRSSFSESRHSLHHFLARFPHPRQTGFFVSTLLFPESDLFETTTATQHCLAWLAISGERDGIIPLDIIENGKKFKVADFDKYCLIKHINKGKHGAFSNLVEEIAPELSDHHNQLKDLSWTARYKLL